MIKMLVFDVDGTLYDLNRHEIPRSCQEAIAEAKHNGLIFVIATGRTHYGLGAALNALEPDYILAVNGAVVADGRGRILAHHDLSMKQVERVNDLSTARRKTVIRPLCRKARASMPIPRKSRKSSMTIRNWRFCAIPLMVMTL